MQKAVLFKIKKEFLGEWKSWCHEVSTILKDEAILSLKEEKVIQEITLCFEIKGDFYGIGYMDGDAFPANPEREINIKHKEVKKRCLEFISDVEILYNIQNR